MVKMKLVDQGTSSPEPPDEFAEDVDQFLRKLRKDIGGDGQEYYELLGVLWFNFLSRDPLNQFELAEKFEISDSLVLDYVQRIEKELQGLDFPDLEHARGFEGALLHRLSNLMDVSREPDAAASPE